MIDCQMHSDHMAQFGAAEVEREEFELELENALASYIKITPPTFIN